MDVGYENKSLEKLCTDEKQMRRQRGDIAEKLRKRINALRAVPTLGDLPSADPLGRWHRLSANWAGCWAAWVSRNDRLVVRPDGDCIDTDATAVTVVTIVDYHG